MSVPAISVIICSHNPAADYLQRTIEGLQAQTLPVAQWQLLLIDNASREPLDKVWDLSKFPGARHVREEKVGLTQARLRGIAEARGELLLFVDDDNVLHPEYLRRALALAEAQPHLGCLGAGVLAPEFEEEPAPEYAWYCRRLALRTVDRAMWSNIPGDDSNPWGAGLIVRRKVALRYAEVVGTCPIRTKLGRTGTGLLSGEDDEFSWIACEMGFGKGIFPELQITHLIDRRRVQPGYFEKIHEGHAFSHVLLRYIHDPTRAVPATHRDRFLQRKRKLKALLSAALETVSWNTALRRRLHVERRMNAAKFRGEAAAEKFIAAGAGATLR